MVQDKWYKKFSVRYCTSPFLYRLNVTKSFFVTVVDPLSLSSSVHVAADADVQHQAPTSDMETLNTIAEGKNSHICHPIKNRLHGPTLVFVQKTYLHMHMYV